MPDSPAPESPTPESPAPESPVADFLVPDLGEGLEEVTLVTWSVAVGDPVALNGLLCLVETAKAEVEVPSPYAGSIVALGGEEGETLRVGALLARIDTSPGGGASREVPGQSVTGGVDSPVPGPTLVGYGHDDTVDRSRRSRRGAIPDPAVAEEPVSRPLSDRTDRPLAKPPVRLLARRLGVDLDLIAPGTGPGGIVTRDDVEAAAPSVPRPPDRDPVPENETSVPSIPVRGVRARIAERMTTSRARIPDATCSVIVDCTRLLEVRDALNDHASRLGLDSSVTPFSLVCRLAVQTLRASLILNATFVEEVPEIRLREIVNLGIGTTTDRGLVVTVVRDAGRLAVHELSTEMARLAAGARAGTLGPADLQGSTFTISNFGALGLDEGIPIINHPEVAILGVGSIRPRPHVVGGEVVARSTASLTLVFDHRVCDGADAGRFLDGLRELVEAPELALLLC
jgi:pyruvate dehydrogenase E2 component (dihydrolipoamide acetyltransferase)